MDIVDILQLVGALFGGFIIHWVMLTPKINKLTSEIASLVKTVNRLEAKADGIEHFRKQIYDLEVRMSDAEAEIRVMDKHIDYNSQDIK